MPAEEPFFDTSYLVRLYLEDVGFEAVRERAAAGPSVAAAWHAQAEIAATLHHAFRERRMASDVFRAALDQFACDREAGLFRWLPLTPDVQRRLEKALRDASASVFIRGADALHLACAAEHGFRAVYSNDRHFLAAAGVFGIKGIDIVSGSEW
jgi:predicted nucleic acid-binding protein